MRERMSKMEEISVILPVYNAARHLDTAIRSILEQRDACLHLYVCDDASTDGSRGIMQAWAARDGRVTCLYNDGNLRAGAARNRCLSEARGDYIALMDADDFSHPDRLKTLKACLDERPDLAFAGTRGRFFRREPGDLEEDYWFVHRPDAKDFLMTLPYVHASLMLRREALDAVGRYDEGSWAVRSEDYDLLMRLQAAGFRGENLNEPLYYIRLDEETYRKRKYRYRLNECLVKWRGFSRMGLMPRAIPYALKPLAVGLVPKKTLERVKRAYYRDR